MKRFLFFVLISVITVYGQISYQGPAEGSVESGVVVSTDSFGKMANTVAPRVKLFINPEFEEIQEKDPSANISTEGVNILPLMNSDMIKGLDDSIFVVQEFQGMPHRNSIPPDPYIAVGPNHIVQVVNSYFRITDKQGNLLKEISASTWYNSVYTGASPFDPKVIYDTFDNRWVMVWLDVNTSASEGYYLISVSDDDNPMGTWYNWALPSNVNGSTPSGGWGDYQGVGFDQQAIYLTSNQFSFGGSYQGTRIRIIDKFGLYANAPGEVSWYDLWSITYPASSYSCFGIRPVRMYDRSDKFYFAVHSPYQTAGNVGVYVLSNPVTSPSLEGYAVSVNTYSTPPSAEQLGGSSIALESGGKNLRNEPVVINGDLYMVHSVAAGTKSGIHYVKVNLENMSAEDDIIFSDNVHYYIYPSLALDNRNNVFFTYSRSSAEEYIGAGFLVYSNSTGQYSQDYLFEPGYGNYVVDYGSGRNRWGDYNGAWQDPSEPNTIWFSTEHVASTNHWGVRIAGVRAYPLENATVVFSADSINFGQVQVGNESNIFTLRLTNYGNETLEITDITHSVGDIEILNSPEFPVVLNAYESLDLSMKFVPSIDTIYHDNLVVVSNSSVASSIKLIAEGYIIREVEQFKLYASNGNAGGGVVATINTNSGEAEVLGESHYKPLRSITINPTNNSLYALSGSAYDESPTILILTSQDGSGYPVGAADIALDAIAFDNNGVLYGAGADNNLYILNLDDSTSTFVGDIPIRFAAITFSHDNNEMYATSRSNASRDLIMKVNVETGDTTHVGRTGRNKVMFGLAFDNNGTLYAAEGTDYQVSDIITINPETGEGELLGSSGIKGITGLSFAMDGIVDVENEPGIVAKFELKQNYPNPFNPETTIKYSLAHSSNVVLKVYDMLGREITTLVSAQQGAGNYSVKFNASNLASGMYIYRLQADGVTLSKKMLLLK